jgi:hypothetical protein
MGKLPPYWEGCGVDLESASAPVNESQVRRLLTLFRSKASSSMVIKFGM